MSNRNQRDSTGFAVVKRPYDRQPHQKAIKQVQCKKL
jgi:hypothetical protein